ncbi:MAG: hypothetical protein R2795_23850 [Saprospiraceae bacterium]
MDRPDQLFLEIIRYPAEFEYFIKIIDSQTEDIGGLGARNIPVPDNVENGYGFFSIAERLTVKIPL